MMAWVIYRLNSVWSQEFLQPLIYFTEFWILRSLFFLRSFLYKWIYLFFFLGLSTSQILLQIITRLWQHQMITLVEFGTSRMQQQSPHTKNIQITFAVVSQANLTGISLSLVRCFFLLFFFFNQDMCMVYDASCWQFVKGHNLFLP